MLELLKTLDARLGEPSTYASIAAILAMTNLKVDPGLWSYVTEGGVVIFGVLGVMLSEVGKKPVSQVTTDTLAALVTAIKGLPTTPPATTP